MIVKALALAVALTKLVPIGTCYITGYTPTCAHCCGKTNGITASGELAECGKTVAMSNDIPFGTRIYISGLGTYIVEDRGVGKGKVDVACASHSECYKITSRRAVYVWEDNNGTM